MKIWPALILVSILLHPSLSFGSRINHDATCSRSTASGTSESRHRIPPHSANLHTAGQIDSLLWSSAYRDSVNQYEGRLASYYMEVLSYDLAYSLSLLPVIGHTYVKQTGTGIAFSAMRAAMVGVGIWGSVRLIGSNRVRPVDLAMIAGGIGGYLYLKHLEVTKVQREVSRLNEELLFKWRIAYEDAEPASIRYPTRDDIPDRLVRPPEKREPQNAREVFDLPLPALNESGTHYRLNFGFDF